MVIYSSNASAFERKSPDVHVQAKRKVGLYIASPDLQISTQQWWAPRGPPAHLWWGLLVLVTYDKGNNKGGLLLYTTLCRKAPPEIFGCLRCLINTSVSFMSLFSVLSDLGLGVAEMLSVLVNALSIMLLAFKRPISHTLSGLVPSAICHKGVQSDISAVGAVYFQLCYFQRNQSMTFWVYPSLSLVDHYMWGENTYFWVIFFPKLLTFF